MQLIKKQFRIPLLAISIFIFAIMWRPYIFALYGYLQIGWETGSPNTFESGHLYKKGDLPILVLRGTHEEMGRQYGQLLGKSLRGISALFKVALSDGKRASYLDYARIHEHLLPKWAREELQAMSAASGVSYLELVAVNVIPQMSCSGLFARRAPNEGGGTIFGRNADYPSLGLDDRGMILVVFKPNDTIAVASVSFLGMVGSFSGMNSAGVSWGNMLVFNSKGASQQNEGLPIQLALRDAGGQESTARGVADRLIRMTHAIPMNAMVVDQARSISLELGDNVHIEESETAPQSASNFFLSPELATYEAACPRRQALLRSAQKAGNQMTVLQMKNALREAIIPNLNIQAIIFEPKQRRMHISVNKNPAASGPYVTVDDGELFF